MRTNWFTRLFWGTKIKANSPLTLTEETTAVTVLSHCPSDGEIIGRLNPWVLACAVGAANGSIYGKIGASSILNLNSWLLCVNRSGWNTGVSKAETEAALRRYVSLHLHQHMNDVLMEEETQRGMKPSVILGPGESMTIKVPIRG
jgi:hypothetical protein